MAKKNPVDRSLDGMDGTEKSHHPKIIPQASKEGPFGSNWGQTRRGGVPTGPGPGQKGLQVQIFHPLYAKKRERKNPIFKLWFRAPGDGLRYAHAEKSKAV